MNAAEIGVTVKDGIVTLTGTVDDYFKKTEAEDAAKNVAGVKAVVEKIEIKFGSSWAEKDDNEIATEVVNALNWNGRIPNNICYRQFCMSCWLSGPSVCRPEKAEQMIL